MTFFFLKAAQSRFKEEYQLLFPLKSVVIADGNLHRSAAHLTVAADGKASLKTAVTAGVTDFAAVRVHILRSLFSCNREA